MLILAWNLSIVWVVFYALTQLHLFENLVVSCGLSKPLFVFFSKLSMQYIQPTCFLVNTLFYLTYISQVIKLIDSKCFASVYSSERQARVIIASMSAFIHILFFGLFVTRIEDFTFNWTSIFDIVSMYTLNLYQFYVCFVLHYYQHATYQLLWKVKEKLSGKVLYIEEDEALEQLRELAVINDSLNRVMSIPILAYTLMNAVQLTLAVCLSILCTPNWTLLANSFFVWVYFAYLAYLNAQIRQLVKRTFIQLRGNYATVDAIRTQRRQHHLVRWQCRALKLQQATLYSSYFSIRIFYLTCISLPVLLSLVLFVANYVLLMTQTN